MARRLKLTGGEALKVWPFETGWKTLTEADLAGVDAVLAEVSPALATPQPLPGELKDAAQVRAMAEHLARLDEAGKLGALFGAPAGAAPEIASAVQDEEGWSLGV